MRRASTRRRSGWIEAGLLRRRACLLVRHRRTPLDRACRLRCGHCVSRDCWCATGAPYAIGLVGFDAGTASLVFVGAPQAHPTRSVLSASMRALRLSCLLVRHGRTLRDRACRLRCGHCVARDCWCATGAPYAIGLVGFDGGAASFAVVGCACGAPTHSTDTRLRRGPPPDHACVGVRSIRRRFPTKVRVVLRLRFEPFLGRGPSGTPAMLRACPSIDASGCRAAPSSSP
jgi:hypothetical protein